MKGLARIVAVARAVPEYILRQVGRKPGIGNASRPIRARRYMTENPLIVFISSPQHGDALDARALSETTFASTPYAKAWLFELALPASVVPREIYLEKVRTCDVFVWLCSDLTKAVEEEVITALDHKRRVLAFVRDEPQLSEAARNLLDRVRDQASSTTLPFDHDFPAVLRDALWSELVRCYRNNPGNERSAALADLFRIGRNRSVRRYESLGVRRGPAAELVDDFDPVTDLQPFMPTVEAPAVLIVGEMGVGKSLLLDRAHRHDLSAAQERPQAPLPVFAHASEVESSLEAHVRLRCADLGEPQVHGVALKLDGLDDAPARSLALLSEAIALLRSWEGSTLMAATRPTNLSDPDLHVVTVAPLVEADAISLVNRVAGGQVAVSTYSWPRSIAEAALRPLFAIRLGLALRPRAPWDRPPSRGELLAGVVRDALRHSEQPSEQRRLLGRLALAQLASTRGAVAGRDIGSFREVESLVATGLVETGAEMRAVRFSLRIIAEWFMADALSRGEQDLASLLTRAPIEVWRDAIEMALADADAVITRDLANALIERLPGDALRMFEDSRASWGVSAELEGSAAEIGGRLVASMKVWVRGLGRLGELLAPSREDGGLTLAVRQLAPGLLETSWYRGADELPPVVVRTDAIRPAQDWPRVATFGTEAEPFWAIRTTGRELQEDLERVLSNHALDCAVPAIRAERAWAAARLLSNERTVFEGPLPVADLRRRLIDAGNPALLRYGSALIDARYLDEALNECDHRGATALNPPWPSADVQHPARSGDTSGFFSDDQLLARTQGVYTAAIAAYVELVGEWFPSMSERMPLWKVLPARLVGILTPRTQAPWGNAATITYWYEPLPSGSRTSLDLRIGPPLGESEERDARIRETYARERPDLQSWNLYTASLLEVWGALPASNLAFKWLAGELRQLGWSSHVPELRIP